MTARESVTQVFIESALLRDLHDLQHLLRSTSVFRSPQEKRWLYSVSAGSANVFLLLRTHGRHVSGCRSTTTFFTPKVTQVALADNRLTETQESIGPLCVVLRDVFK